MTTQIADIARQFIKRGVILEPEDGQAVRELEPEQLEELYETLQELPESDFARVKGEVRRFVRLFDRLDKESFFALKAELAKRYGRAFFDDFVGTYERADLSEVRPKRGGNSAASKAAPAESAVEEREPPASTELPERERTATSDGPASTSRTASAEGTGSVTEQESAAETPSVVAREDPDWEILFSYEELDTKRTYDAFVQFYRNRLRQLSFILKGRYELRNALPARRIKANDTRETVAFIGIVTETRETKNGNLVIKAEDQTGELTLIAHNSKPEVIAAAEELVNDEVVGFRGMRSGDAVFLDEIIWPDVPIDAPMHHAEENIGAVFISDIQYGGSKFFDVELERFLDWIRGEGEDAELAKNVKYLFVVGDLIEGVGIFPGQEHELKVMDVRDQFATIAEYLSRVPEHITIFIIAGNHEPIRLAEPQPVVPIEYAPDLWKLPNVVMLSNPSAVKIGKKDGLGGVEVLLYHGASMDYYARNNDKVRQAGGWDAPVEMMKFLLKRRHLAPTHGSTLYVIDPRKDYHVIERVPDIFATGHVHRMQASTYRATTLLQCGAWIGVRPIEIKAGHAPDSGKAFHVNLKSRRVTMIDFLTDERREELQEKGWL